MKYLDTTYKYKVNYIEISYIIIIMYKCNILNVNLVCRPITIFVMVMIK